MRSDFKLFEFAEMLFVFQDVVYFVGPCSICSRGFVVLFHFHVVPDFFLFSSGKSDFSM